MLFCLGRCVGPLNVHGLFAYRKMGIFGVGLGAVAMLGPRYAPAVILH
jgi:hypothetical protein